jgi:hypothetical protein
MPIDPQLLKDTLREALGGDGELYALAEQKLLMNEKAATDFLAGFMRNRDYTQKTQALAADRTGMDDQKRVYEGQIAQYQQLLQDAENAKGQVLRDLAQRDESLAGAYSRLKTIKQRYQLSDDDIPTYEDLIRTEQKGRPVDSSTDIDQKLAAFKQDIHRYLTEKLVPELGGMAQLDIVWSDIRDEHRELTGKRMTAKEQQELLNEADKRSRAGRPVSLKALWEEKYEVPDLRQKHHDGELEKKLRQKWDDEQKVKLSEQAMQGIRPTSPEAQGLQTSNIFQHKFQLHEDKPGDAPKTRVSASAAERESMSGAERAGKRFLERRAQGIPMGAPDERQKKSA